MEMTGFTSKELIDYEIDFREIFFDIMEEAFKPMRFSNTDGEPIVLYEIFYDLNCTPLEVFEALLPLSSEGSLLRWEDGKFDVDGNFVEVDVSWVRVNSENEILASVSLGNFTITPTGLKVFVNSKKRAANIRKEIKNRLGDKVSFKKQKKTSMSTSEDLQKKDKQVDPEIDPINYTPEMVKVLREHLDKNWMRWLDVNIPALGDLTPRQAAKSESGREKLEAIFLDFESHNKTHVARGEEFQQVDINFLKKELGLS